MTVPVKFDEKVWGRLASIADSRGTTIPKLIEDAVTILVGTRAPTTKPGSRSGYTKAAGETIIASRRSGWTWPRIADDLGVSTFTARKWADRYLREATEQTMRDRAGRRGS